MHARWPTILQPTSPIAADPRLATLSTEASLCKPLPNPNIQGRTPSKAKATLPSSTLHKAKATLLSSTLRKLTAAKRPHMEQGHARARLKAQHGRAIHLSFVTLNVVRGQVSLQHPNSAPLKHTLTPAHDETKHDFRHRPRLKLSERQISDMAAALLEAVQSGDLDRVTAIHAEASPSVDFADEVSKSCCAVYVYS